MNHNFIKDGYTPIIDCHTSHIACKFEKILAKIDKKDGKIIEEMPESVKTGDTCLVKMVPTKSFTCEKFSDFP